MLLQVHDELLFEVAPGEFDALRELVCAAMAAAAALRVPLDVSVGSGPAGGCRPLTALAGGSQGPVRRDRYAVLWPVLRLTPWPCSHILNAALCPRVFRLSPDLTSADRASGRRACHGRPGWFRDPGPSGGAQCAARPHNSLSASGANPHMTSTTEANSTPKVAVNDIGSEEAFLAAIDETIKYFNDGDIVEGTVVKVDRDEVLLDIGYKTEGVIPSRELSIKHDVDPHDVVKTGEHIEALVLQKEDKEGRLILSKKRAQYERAWGTIEKIKEEDGVVTGTVIEVVKGGLILDIGLRGFLPASLVEMRRVRDLQPYVGRELEAKIIELDKNRNNVVLSRRAWLEQTQSEVRHTFLNTLQRARSARASCPRSSTSARSSTWAAWTAWCTCPSCPGSTSTTPARWSRSARRSPSRCWTWTWTASASRCR